MHQRRRGSGAETELVKMLKARAKYDEVKALHLIVFAGLNCSPSAMASGIQTCSGNNARHAACRSPAKATRSCHSQVGELNRLAGRHPGRTRPAPSFAPARAMHGRHVHVAAEPGFRLRPTVLQAGPDNAEQRVIGAVRREPGGRPVRAKVTMSRGPCGQGRNAQW